MLENSTSKHCDSFDMQDQLKKIPPSLYEAPVALSGAYGFACRVLLCR